MSAMYCINGKRASCGSCVNRYKGAYYVRRCFKPECAPKRCDDCDKSGMYPVVAKYGFCLIKNVARWCHAKPCDAYKEAPHATA
jgi:hypothetical protein